MTADDGAGAHALAARLLPWFTQHFAADDVQVVDAQAPSAGYSSRIVLVTLSVDGRAERRVVRMAPDGPGLFEHYDVAAQTAGMELAADAGCPIPRPLIVETDLTVVGTPFVVMPWVDGQQCGESPAFDPWCRALTEEQQARRCTSLLDAVARVHAADTTAAVERGVPARDDAAEVAHWQHYLQWAFDGAPQPGLVDALAWCAAHIPEPEGAPVLLWGDVRPGNVIWNPDATPRAVLDWDMTSVGAREHDLAWLTTLEDTMAVMTRRTLPGQLDRAATIAHYEQASGIPLTDLGWYEVLAMTRSTAIMTRISHLTARAGRPTPFPLDDNPLLDLLAARVARAG